MKYVLSVVVALFLVLSLSACKTEKKAAEQQAQKPAAEAQAKFDLTQIADSLCVGDCGMVFKNSSQIADTVHYKGKVYGVCSEKCKEAFKSDPEGHLAHLHQPMKSPEGETH